MRFFCVRFASWMVYGWFSSISRSIISCFNKNNLLCIYIGSYQPPGFWRSNSCALAFVIPGINWVFAGSVRLQSLLLLAAFALGDVRYRMYLYTFIYCDWFYISTICANFQFGKSSTNFQLSKKYVVFLPLMIWLGGVATAEVFPNASKHGVTWPSSATEVLGW